jgi:hypothetical protein
VIRTQISMTEQQAEGLRRLAALRRRSQAAVLRDALDDILEQDHQVRRVAKARDAVGAFRSGRGDGSERHDEALVDAFAS